jgi:hypothetical protein
MHTLIQLHNANCAACLNAIQDQILSQQRVRGVHVDAAHGCLEVDHDHDDPEVLVELLRRSLRGWQIAGNGEIVQVPEAPELTHVCRAAHAESNSTLGSNELGGEAPCLAHRLDNGEFRSDWPS